MNNITITEIEKDGVGVRKRAILWESQMIEIVTEFKNPDTGEWEHLESKFLNLKELEACNQLLKEE